MGRDVGSPGIGPKGARSMNKGFRLVAGGLALLAALCLFPANVTAAALNVYMVRGKGAVSILDKPAYQNVFKTIFQKQNLTIDLTGGKEAFLGKFFAGDLIYLSLHSNPGKLVVANGDGVEVADLLKAYRKAGRGPGLVIVTGCQTIRRDGLKVNLQSAMGIKNGEKGRAFIGYKTFAPGMFSDRYFRVFLASWQKPKPDGNYRTLAETVPYARDFIRRMLKLQGPHTGEIARFAPLDAMVAGWLHIVGDPGLTFDRLGENTGAPPVEGKPAPAPDKASPPPANPDGEREILLFK